jgi:UDP-glucuronate 4-epimerase
MSTYLVTWSSGFIWYHTSKRLLEGGNSVIGVDNENDYYDISLKHHRRSLLEKYDNYSFYSWGLEDDTFLEKVFSENTIDKVCHLGAQAWVRYSLENPRAYIDSNLIGFFNIIELAKKHTVQNFVYASSSSVYGANEKIPFSESDNVDHPVSLYAATKKSNELIAHTYSHLYKLPTTWLRFFTVYGPLGRPDMAPDIFTRKISSWETIDVYNFGKMQRDFTYIDDIVDGVIKSLETISDYEVFNLWNHNPVELERFIEILEENIGKKADKNYMEIQPGDVPRTFADIDHTYDKLWWKAQTSLEQWLKKFVEAYKNYYKV